MSDVSDFWRKALEANPEVMAGIEAQRRELGVYDDVCGWEVGPVWKAGGEVCRCAKQSGHDMPHECDCGSWFEGCGRAPKPDSGASA